MPDEDARHDESDTTPKPQATRVDTLEIDSVGRRVMIVRIGDERLDPSPLSAAEKQVASLVSAGLSNADIARKRGTSVRTVEKQLSSIYEKLGVLSRHELRVRGLSELE